MYFQQTETLTQCWAMLDQRRRRWSALATIGPISCVCLTVVMVEWSSCCGQPVCDLIVVTLYRMSGRWSVGQAAWVGYYKIITCAHKVIWTVPLRAEVASACHKTLEIKGCMYHFANIRHTLSYQRARYYAYANSQRKRHVVPMLI